MGVASDFLNKNTDPLHPDLLDLMQHSECGHLAALFGADSSASGDAKQPAKRGALYSKTVGSRFKEQLADLMKLIGSTQVHYIRCVKPNPVASAEQFDTPLVADQLRFAGMQEAVRISRAA